MDKEVSKTSFTHKLLISIGNTHIQYGIFTSEVSKPLSFSTPLRHLKQLYPHTKKEKLSSKILDSIKEECRRLIRELLKDVLSVNAYIASVNPGLNIPIQTVVEKEFGCPTYIFTHRDLPITTQYDLPSMGIDRLLKIYTANKLIPKKHSNLIIIDFGTAITVDVIKNYAHLGGMIISGFHTSLRSLHTFTEQLPQLSFIQSKPSYNITLLGNNTNESILNGSFHFYAQAINGIIHKTMVEYFENEGCKLWITGGDSEYFYSYLQDHLDIPTEHLEHLNLSALNIATSTLK